MAQKRIERHPFDIPHLFCNYDLWWMWFVSSPMHFCSSRFADRDITTVNPGILFYESSMYNFQFHGQCTLFCRNVGPVVLTRVYNYVCWPLTFMITCASLLLGSARLQHRQPWHLTVTSQSKAVVVSEYFDGRVLAERVWETRKW